MGYGSGQRGRLAGTVACSTVPSVDEPTGLGSPNGAGRL